MALDHLTHHTATIGDRIAVIDDRRGRPARVATFGELNRAANQLANGLASLGVGPNHRVAWWGANGLEVMTTIHAIRKVGGVSVPIPYRSTLDEGAWLLEHADAAAVVVDAEYAEGATEAVLRLGTPIPVVVYGGEPTGDQLAWTDVLAATTEPDIAGHPEVTRAMIYTSGTTGRPKGAIRPVGGEPNQFGALLELLGWRDHELIFLTTGPLYHSGPSGFALRAHLVGGTVVTQNRFDPEDWLRLIQDHRVTSTFAAPTPIRRIVRLPAEVKARYDVTSMRCMIANAAPWTTSLKEAYLRDFPEDSLWEVYGSTELSICTVLRPEDQRRKPGSCGQPAPGVEVVLFDEDGEEVTRPYQPGELFVRSGGVFETYHKDRERYEADQIAGYQTVGDIAYFDDEGYYTICDRKKDMVITGGVNVYPAEIENVIDAHPLVVEVAVFGVPDDEWGEAVSAAVVTDGPVTPAELKAFARQELSGPKVPKHIDLVHELPKTGSGKVLKRQLKERYGRDS